MAQAVTPSADAKTTTSDQIDKAVSLYREMLEKHAAQFEAEAVQTVLGQPELATDQFAVFRTRVEAIRGMIVRRVKVDRRRAPKEAMKATRRNQYVNEDAVTSMPRGEGDEVDVYFFKVGRTLSDPDLEKEFELRGLKPDAYAQAQVNTDDPEFADEKPNSTHWKDGSGKWCYAIFERWGDVPVVNVRRVEFGCRDSWWFAGVRK